MRKQGIFRRAAAVFLALALMAGAVPAAFAADTAEETIKEANEKNNFDYVYSTSPETVTTNSNGIVTQTFTKPTETVNDESAKSGTFYAAILPVDADGSPVSGKDVRYVRLTEEGNQLHLTYFRDGCGKFQVMLVQPQPDGGDAAIEATSATPVTHYTANGSDHEYTVEFKATLEMSATLAQIADWNKDDEAMDQLTFTAHLRLPKGVNGTVSNITLDSEIFQIKENGITKVQGDENGYDIECELIPDKDNDNLPEWQDTATGESLVDKLQEEMSITGTATITGENIQKLVSAGQNELYLVGWNTISGIPEASPLDANIQVPAATYALPIQVVDNSGGTTRYPVNVAESANGSASSSHNRASAGTKVTITVAPDEGYRLNTLTVRDSKGNRVEVTANADGTYTFTMPAAPSPWRRSSPWLAPIPMTPACPAG